MITAIPTAPILYLFNYDQFEVFCLHLISDCPASSTLCVLKKLIYCATCNKRSVRAMWFILPFKLNRVFWRCTWIPNLWSSRKTPYSNARSSLSFPFPLFALRRQQCLMVQEEQQYAYLHSKVSGLGQTSLRNVNKPPAFSFVNGTEASNYYYTIIYTILLL